MGINLTIKRDKASIPNIVKGWGSSNSVLFYQRLVSLLDDTPCGWAYLWMAEILKL